MGKPAGKSTLGAAASAVLLLTVAGCGSDQPADIAAAHASPLNSSPSVKVAVGPVPGPQVNVPVVTNPYAKDPAAQLAGRRLFVQMNCSGCHGDHAGGGMGPSLRDPDWLYGDNDGQIFDSIAHGRGKGMPAWGMRLPDQQIWLLVSYIKTLSTRNEPDPPSQ